MSKAAHTPGPWCVESAMGEKTDIALAYDIPGEGSPLVIACCFPGDKGDEKDCGPPSHKEAMANARLMAAAPDLLAACKIAITAAENGVVPSMAEYEIIQAAISKAEGGAS